MLNVTCVNNRDGRISALVIAQTGSAVLGLLGMMHIVLSFTLAYFVYGVVLGFHWFPFLNLLGCEFTSAIVHIPYVPVWCR